MPTRKYVLIVADYSQIELKVLAHYSRDPTLLRAYKEGLDVHAVTASKVLSIPMEEVTPEQRGAGKTTSFLCLTKGHLVLTRDLDWVPVETLREGDQLWGFDEHVNPLETQPRKKARKWRPSVVEATGLRYMPTVTITLETGERLCSTLEHPWMVADQAGNGRTAKWRNAEDIRVGHRLRRYLPTWKRDDSWEAGWLAGIADGEGSVRNSIGSTEVNVLSQNTGEVLDYAINALGRRGFQLKQPNKRVGCVAVNIRGKLSESLRFLGETKPKRLRLDLTGVTFQAISDPKVVGVEYTGWKEVVTLGTSTHTYLANGFAAHNTVYGGGYHKLSTQQGISLRAAKKFLAGHRAEFPRIYSWKQDVVVQCKRNRVTTAQAAAYGGTPQPPHVLTILGRKRRLPGILFQDSEQRGYAERQAVNALIQGSAADIQKLAMVRYHRLTKNTDHNLLLTVHDELVVSVPAREVDQGVAWIKEAMEGVELPEKLRVPLTVDVKVCDSWAEAKG